MNVFFATLLCIFYLCVSFSAVSSKWNAVDVVAIEKLKRRLNLLEQRLTREHVNLSDISDKSFSNENNNRLCERWISDIEIRIETLENTILQKNCDRKIQSLEETVQELSKQVKHQALYNERTEKLEAIVKDQEKTISELREEVMQIKRPDSVVVDFLVKTEVQNDTNGSNKDNYNNHFGKTQRIRSIDSSSGPLAIGSNKKRLLLPSTLQPVTTSNPIAFYAYMAATTISITIQHTLTFDVVKTNVGNGYHPASGVFFAPETGFYVFTWTMRENGNCRHSTQLMVNKEELGIIHVHVGSGGDMEGTGIVVAHVNAGDDVYVQTHASWNDCYIVSDVAGRSSFAGWKLS